MAASRHSPAAQRGGGQPRPGAGVPDGLPCTPAGAPPDLSVPSGHCGHAGRPALGRGRVEHLLVPLRHEAFQRLSEVVPPGHLAEGDTEAPGRWTLSGSPHHSGHTRTVLPVPSGTPGLSGQPGSGSELWRHAQTAPRSLRWCVGPGAGRTAARPVPSSSPASSSACPFPGCPRVSLCVPSQKLEQETGLRVGTRRARSWEEQGSGGSGSGRAGAEGRRDRAVRSQWQVALCHIARGVSPAGWGIRWGLVWPVCWLLCRGSSGCRMASSLAHSRLRGRDAAPLGPRDCALRRASCHGRPQAAARFPDFSKAARTVDTGR